MGLRVANWYLFYENEKEFYHAFKDKRDPNLIRKLAKSVISAVSKKLDHINVFEVTFKDSSSQLYIVRDFHKTLSQCMQDMIDIEDYEICAKIRDTLNKLEKSKNKRSKLKNSIQKIK